MEPGELIAGRYRLSSVIGRGAMGIVWRARDERLERPVAVKQLLPASISASTATAGEASRRAMREGRIAGRLRHPNAIAVHDVVEHAGTPCLIMEYLPSESLAAVVAARGGLPPAEVAGIGGQIAAALAEAHAAGIVHRDIKPENVLITADGTAKITDFGVSRAVGDGTVTAAGIIVGTPAYLAPEVAAGGEADFRSDVFSLGATLYAALEGTPPFGLADNPIALLHRVAGGEITPPRASGPLSGLLLWLLCRDPGERPSMRAAHEALSAAADGRPVPEFGRRTPTLVLPTRRVSRRAVVGGIGGIAAAGLVAAGVVLGSVLSNPESTGATGTTETTETTGTTPGGGPTCVARYEITNSWPDGYEARVTVRNDGNQTLTGWQVSWTLPDGQDIDNLWAGTLTRDGSAVTVTNADWNVTVPRNGSTSFGLVAKAPREDPVVPEVRCQSR